MEVSGAIHSTGPEDLVPGIISAQWIWQGTGAQLCVLLIELHHKSSPYTNWCSIYVYGIATLTLPVLSHCNRIYNPTGLIVYKTMGLGVIFS